MHSIFLKYFDEVARQGSIRKAALVLNVSSTSVNRKILSVEDKLGVSLFTRTPEGVELTAVGGILLEHCRTTLHDYNRAKVLIDDARDLRTGHINVHTVDSVALSVLPQAIRKFSDAFPDISISVTTAQPDEVIQAVADGSADIGISFSFESHPDARVLSEKSAPFGILVRPDHPLVGRSSVRIDDIAPYRMVRTIDARGRNSIIDQAIASLASPLSTHIFTNMLTLAKQMILDNQGIGLYTKIGFYDEIMRGELCFVPLMQETLTNVRIGVFVSATQGIDPAKRLLCAAVQRTMAPMRLDN
ncbi:LysR family transcriptional regulator [Frigidibacter sp. ROC022]|uniref:LysR family transcriptional regulator n=1 Tax=Frigidibacter sp. ROC022 TaxID=2971796 RepID=UPI00215AE00C|nr:LysR family transcriptional regulator [Frigidibacter sp. ROC022]MCR8724988.1 LysR family transcriptional regulator [Frigidibacter sp. ROC022]